MDEDDEYIKTDFIGKGSGGTLVYKVKSLNNGQYYALKKVTIYFNNEGKNDESKNEIEIFKTLNHPNLIKYETSYIKKGTLNIIMEYADGGDLTNQLKKHKNENKKIDEDLIWYWFLQICQGIRYMHSKRIIHRDIKCQNIFLTSEGIIKLGDFGISKLLEHSFDYSKTPLGTPYFLSPEICSGSKYNFKIDMWMLGCVLYELTTFRKPFEGKTIPELMDKIINREVLPIPKSYSEDLKTLISKLLCKSPNNRPSIKEVLGYDFIINKMNKFGFTKRYIDWNECYIDDNISKNSPYYSLFNLRFFNDKNNDKESNGNNNSDNDYENIDENDNNEEIDDLSKKLNNFNISPSPNISRETSQDNSKELYQIKGKSYDNRNIHNNKNNNSNDNIPIRQISNHNVMSFEDKIKLYKKNNQNNNNELHNKKDNKKNYFTLKYNSNPKVKEIEFSDEVDCNQLKKKPTPNEVVSNNNNYSKICIKYGFFCEQFSKEKMDKLIQKIQDCNGNLKDINSYIQENFEGKWSGKLCLFSEKIVNLCY